MTIADAQKLTVSEFLQQAESPAGEHLELVDGEVIMSPRPSFAHQYTSAMLSYVLVGYLKERKLGIILPEVDTILGARDVRVPDLLYFSADRAPTREKQDAAAFPNLCIEIVSPSNARIDRIEKFQLYQARGISFYWIVDPEERTIEAYELENGRYISSGRGAGDDLIRLPPFADLEIPLGTLWLP